MPYSEKDEARKTVQRLKETLRPVGKLLLVRVNSVQSGLVQEDLKGVARVPIDGILIPKVDAPEDLQSTITFLERAKIKARDGGPVGLLPIIESPKGLLSVDSIVSVSPHIRAICFGGVDYTRQLGYDLTKDPQQTLYARSRIAVAARAFNRWAFDTVFPDLNDNEGLLRDCQVAKMLGYQGKLVIHPKQIEVVNRVFSISQQEMKKAQRILASFEEAQSSGRGVVLVDGEMIDEAAYKHARQLLASAKAFHP